MILIRLQVEMNIIRPNLIKIDPDNHLQATRWILQEANLVKNNVLLQGKPLPNVFFFSTNSKHTRWVFHEASLVKNVRLQGKSLPNVFFFITNSSTLGTNMFLFIQIKMINVLIPNAECFVYCINILIYLDWTYQTLLELSLFELIRHE